jgi:alcohol dehydrogenase
MEKVFAFQGAKKIVFGQGACQGLAEEINTLGAKKVFVVLDRVLSELKAVRQVVDMLGSKGINPFLYGEITPEPEPVLADRGAELAKEQGCDIVVGIGGGSSLDVAKAIAVLVTNDGKAEDYIGLEKVKSPGLPTIMIPTTAGTGSEVTFTAVFTMREKKRKGGINSHLMYPDVALLDPELTLSLPPQPTATTGIDALTHAIEAYTSLQSNPMSDMVAKNAIALIGANLRHVMNDGQNRQARHNMLLGSLMGGLALASAGVGACHALAYSLGAFFDIPHGLANAVLLPYIMEYNMESADTKYARVGSLMKSSALADGVEASSRSGVQVVRKLTKDVGIPQSLKDLGVPESAIQDMAKMAMTVARPLENNPRKVTKDDAIKIYESAF